jgi:universal stress protein E
MKKIDSVLVVLDKPKHEQTALARAREVQAKTGAHLHLVSFCWQAMCEESDIFDAHQRRAMKKEILRAREEWLRGQVLDLGLAAADISIQTVWTDDIAGWVGERAQEGAVDLVLKSVHHSETLLHTPLDWQLIRECPAPLLLVAAPVKKRRKRKPTGKVLATLDLRHADRKHRLLNLKVLDAASVFTRLAEGEMHCVHVIEYSEVLSDLDFIDARKVRKEKTEKSKALLDALIEPYGIARARVHMPAGKVGQLVNATARKIDADLLVVGTAARRGVGAALLGNSAERILSRAGCDLLVVHP